MSLYAKLAGRGPSGFGYGSTAEEVTQGLSLAGRTYLVTGATSGIGFETLRVLALRGAHVLAAGRTLAKASEACSQVAGNATPIECELSEPSSVRRCIEQLGASTTLDAVIGNAGIMAVPKLTLAYGYELQFFTNHIGHFQLITGLLPRLSPSGRVVMVSSAMHERAPAVGIDFDNLRGERGYSAWEAYGRSKLANLLFAKELARRFRGTDRTANAVHPGVIRTRLMRHQPSVGDAAMAALGPLFLKTTAQGAATQTYVAVRPELAGTSGVYFADCNVKRSRADADDAALAERLWEASERIVREVAGG